MKSILFKIFLSFSLLFPSLLYAQTCDRDQPVFYCDNWYLTPYGSCGWYEADGHRSWDLRWYPDLGVYIDGVVYNDLQQGGMSYVLAGSLSRELKYKKLSDGSYQFYFLAYGNIEINISSSVMIYDELDNSLVASVPSLFNPLSYGLKFGCKSYYAVLIFASECNGFQPVSYRVDIEKLPGNVNYTFNFDTAGTFNYYYTADITALPSHTLNRYKVLNVPVDLYYGYICFDSDCGQFGAYLGRPDYFDITDSLSFPNSYLLRYYDSQWNYLETIISLQFVSFVPDFINWGYYVYNNENYDIYYGEFGFDSLYSNKFKSEVGQINQSIVYVEYGGDSSDYMSAVPLAFVNSIQCGLSLTDVYYLTKSWEWKSDVSVYKGGGVFSLTATDVNENYLYVYISYTDCDNSIQNSYYPLTRYVTLPAICNGVVGSGRSVYHKGGSVNQSVWSHQGVSGYEKRR